MEPESDVSRDWRKQRALMVSHQLEARGIHDRGVLAAMNEIPREFFVPEELRDRAYDDGPLGIGYGQTISQPWTVAIMTQALQLTGREKVLEVGTGSGYATCILSRLAKEVHTIERVGQLARVAEQRFQRLRIHNVRVHVGDGSLGLPSHAPFDGIIVTAAGPCLPAAYRTQLSEGGRIVIPVGSRSVQQMMRYTLRNGVLEEEALGDFVFVPLIGADAWPDF